jgi:hypothetical protein
MALRTKKSFLFKHVECRKDQDKAPSRISFAHTSEYRSLSRVAEL